MSKGFTDGFSEETSSVSTLEKVALDDSSQAWILDNGRVVIQSDTNGIETVLDPHRAYALLDLLYRHRDTLYQATHQD